MRGDLQSRIKPPSEPPPMQINSLPVRNSANAPARDSNALDRTSFRDLLMNSNADMSAKRTAMQNGDLSAAKNDEEFFAMLADKAGKNNDRTAKNSLDKDAFMRLFVTQLQNQDPLNPDDSAKMAAQLAQFNGLEQMMNVNKNLEKMSQDQALGRAVNLIGFVGQEVQVDGGATTLAEGGHTPVLANVTTAVPRATLTVRDTAGVVIAEQSLGNLSAGNAMVQWDGKNKEGQPAPHGRYTFSVSGEGLSGERIEVPLEARVKVKGVDLSDGGKFHTAMGPVDVGNVKSVGKLVEVQNTHESNKPKVDPLAPQGPVPAGAADQAANQPKPDAKAVEQAIQQAVEQAVPPPAAQADKSAKQTDNPPANPVPQPSVANAPAVNPAIQPGAGAPSRS